MNTTVALSVIGEVMIQTALEEQGPQGYAGLIAKEEGIQYEAVLQLCLDHRSIHKIDNLWQFASLKKLQLDNNHIENIQGLEGLVNLEWLDLSFNKIEVIEGLDSLVKLLDLSLFNNRISVIQNMDSLQQLQILSIGNNAISELDNIEYLWAFKNLRSLIMAGNPVCEEEKYKICVAAFLPNLVYLDFKLMDKETIQLAETDFTFANKKQIKQNKQRTIDSQISIDKELQYHKDAFVEFLNGPQLFDSMVADDVESAKLASLPGVDIESYRNKVVSLCKQIFDVGLSEHAARQEEVEAFFSCFREAVAANQERAAQFVLKFEKSKKNLIAKMEQTEDPALFEAQVCEYNDGLIELSDTLTLIELELLDQLEDVVKDFERNISEMVDRFTQCPKDLFGQCRDQVKVYHEKLLDISTTTMSKLSKEEPEIENVPEDVCVLFEDKDLVINSINESLDAHLLKIDNREDELMKRINSWLQSLTESIHYEEFERNRQRVLEFDNYTSYLKDRLAKVQLRKSQQEEPITIP